MAEKWGSALGACGAHAEEDGNPGEGQRVMKELVEYIAKSLASYPDQVKVTQEEENGRIILRLEVADDDKGKIIGRQGRVAQAIRALLRVAAVKEGARAILEIV